VSLGGGYDPRRGHKQELIRFMVSWRILRDWNSLSRRKFMLGQMNGALSNSSLPKR
jgi:hypothetical protein